MPPIIHLAQQRDGCAQCHIHRLTCYCWHHHSQCHLPSSFVVGVKYLWLYDTKRNSSFLFSQSCSPPSSQGVIRMDGVCLGTQHPGSLSASSASQCFRSPFPCVNVVSHFSCGFTDWINPPYWPVWPESLSKIQNTIYRNDELDEICSKYCCGLSCGHT